MPRFEQSTVPANESHPSVADLVLNHDLPRSYTACVESLRTAGLLEPILSGDDGIALEMKEGITALNGMQYELPSIEAIQKHFSAEKYKEKIEQGFTRLLVVPFGYPLETFKIRYTELLLKKHKQGKLLSSDGEKLDLRTNMPLYFFKGFNHSDETGEMIYYPTTFDKSNHGGTTKKELLQDKTQPFHGFHVLLLKPDLTIPRAGKAKITGTRKDLEAGQSFIDYLKTIQTQPQYRLEQGMTLEDEFTLAITELETRSRVINDYKNENDSINFTVANYHIASSSIPLFRWSSSDRHALVDGRGPWSVSMSYGARVAVG